MTKLLSFIACLIIALAAVANATVHAFIWDNTTGMTDLGSLGGDSIANGINDSGQIVGYSYLADQSTIHMAMWTTTGGIVDLGSLDPSGYSQGNAINSAGDIVGTGTDANSRQVAFFWSSSTGYVSLGEIGQGYATGNDINDSDTIAGWVSTSQGIVWRPSFPRPQYIGTLAGGSESIALGINNLGHITGGATPPASNFDAIVWTKAGGIRDIGTVQAGVSTYGFGINDNDEVVGFGGIREEGF